MGMKDSRKQFERAVKRAATVRMLDLDQFRTAVFAQAFRPVRIRAMGQEFCVEGLVPRKARKKKEEEEVDPMDIRTLCTSRSRKARLFRNPFAALWVLKSIGVTVVEVEMSHWSPKGGTKLGASRPDVAYKLQLVHEWAKGE
jgi:hypothetical protein